MIKKIGIILIPVGTLIIRVLLATNPLVGFILNLSILACSFSLALISRHMGILMAALSLPLLITFVQLGTVSLGTFERLIISYSVLLALGLSYGQIHKLNHRLSNTKKSLSWLVTAVLVGTLVGTIQYLLLASPWIRPDANSVTIRQTLTTFPIGLVLLIIPVIAYAEEVVFRYLIYNESSAHFSPIPASIIANTLYASLWLPDAPRATVVLFASGMLFSYIYIEQKNLLTVTLANTLSKYIFLIATLFLFASE